jgi:hypothetical protein
MEAVACFSAIGFPHPCQVIESVGQRIPNGRKLIKTASPHLVSEKGFQWLHQAAFSLRLH